MLTRSSPPMRPYLRLLNRLGWALLLFFPIFYTANGFVEAIFAFLPSNPVVRALYGVFSTAAYAAPFFLSGLIFSLFSRSEKGKYDASFAIPRPVQDRIFLPAFFPLLVLAGLGLNQIASEVNYYLGALIGYIPTSFEPVYYDTPASAILYMTTAIAPAFAEEYLFRGVVYGNLRPYGKWQAVFISAMTFALMHQNVGQLFYTFVCGIVMALMYEWTGSIWCSVFFHLFNNEFAVLTESLIYGAYGESVYDIILVWSLVLVILGLISAVILIVYARGRKKDSTTMENPNIFGTGHLSEHALEAWDRPMERRNVRRGLRAPGMLTYILFSAFTILIDYLVVMGEFLMGG